MAPNHCYFGVLGHEKISYLQATTYGEKEEYCYLGAYIVRKEFRGKGYGKKTWDFAWADLPESCLISLSTAPPQDATYSKVGFKTHWKEFTYTFESKKVADFFPYNGLNVKTVRLKDANFQSLLQYDRNVFCYSRESYLKKVLEVPDSEGWVALSAEGEIVGYVVARFTLDTYGWFLLPLIAENVTVAEALIVELSKFLVTQPVTKFTMTIPDINNAAVCLAHKLSASLILESCRMFTRGNPPDKMTQNHASTIFSMSYAVG